MQRGVVSESSSVTRSRAAVRMLMRSIHRMHTSVLSTTRLVYRASSIRSYMTHRDIRDEHICVTRSMIGFLRRRLFPSICLAFGSSRLGSRGTCNFATAAVLVLLQCITAT